MTQDEAEGIVAGAKALEAAVRLGAHFSVPPGRRYLSAESPSLRGFCSINCWDIYWRKKTNSDIMKRGA